MLWAQDYARASRDQMSVRAVETNHTSADGEQTISAAGGEVVLVAHIAADSWLFVDARLYTFPAIPA